MRVGVVTTSYPRFGGDAAGSFVAGHVAYLRAAAGVDAVEVIAADDRAVDRALDAAEGITRIAAPPGLFYAGGAPEAIAVGATAGPLAFAARMAAAVAVRARRWDAIAAHWLAPSALAAVPTRGPLLAIGHGGDVHLLDRRRLLGPALAVLAARGARLAFVAEPLRARASLAWAGAAAAIVQPMGVDGARAARVAARRAARVRTDDAITVAVVARLVPIKAIDVAIDALAALPPRFRLAIAGDGPARAALVAHAHARGVAARVAFLGWLDADRRDDLLARADVVAVASAPLPDGRVEGTPLAALEALAAGVPLVVTAIGGLAALAQHGAIAIAPRDPAALAAAIERAHRAAPSPIAGLDWPAVGAALDAHWGRTA